MEPGTIVRMIGKTGGAKVGDVGTVVLPHEVGKEKCQQLCSHLLENNSLDAINDFVAVKFLTGGQDGFYMKPNLTKVWSISE